MSRSPSSAASAVAPNGMSDLMPMVEMALQEACQWTSACPPRLSEAMRYALLAPGKRLRPAMVLMACEAVGGKLSDGLPGAVAVEMVHAYSLIHDDLPAMDDDDLRRGRPTTHIQFDEATAILAGDALLAAAFEHLSHKISEPSVALECVRCLSAASGPQALVGGQMEDLAAEQGGEQTLCRLEAIHRRKTGALFDAAIRMGGLLGGASPAELAHLEQYSQPLGLAFQVVDDCLDHTATAHELGKRTGKDQARGKLTYPGLLGLDEAKKKAADLIQAAILAVDMFGSAAWRLRWLARFVQERSH